MSDNSDCEEYPEDREEAVEQYHALVHWMFDGLDAPTVVSILFNEATRVFLHMVDDPHQIEKLQNVVNHAVKIARASPPPPGFEYSVH